MKVNFILIFVIIVSVFSAGLFAGAETGMYQLNLLRLRLGIEKRKLSFIILGRVMRDSPSLLISTLLGTNLSHYIATSFITYLLLTRFNSEHTVELFATIVAAPILFIFSELIPKNLFFYRSDTLMPYTAFILFIFNKIFGWLGIVPILKYITRSFGGTTQPLQKPISAVRSSYIKAIIRDTRKEGFLSPVQTGIINRMAHIGHLTIRSVMTAFNKALSVDINSNKTCLLSLLEHFHFTRLLVYKHRKENVVGYIDIYECLTSGQEFPDLKDFLQPIHKLPADTLVTEAISIMQKTNEKIVLVTKQRYAKPEKPLGIVTMKDLAEEILGELTEW